MRSHRLVARARDSGPHRSTGLFQNVDANVTPQGKGYSVEFAFRSVPALPALPASSRPPAPPPQRRRLSAENPRKPAAKRCGQA